MVKTLNRFGDYSFALNICQPVDTWNYVGNRVSGLKFYQNSVTSSEEMPANELKLKCYPNPASEYLVIEFEKADGIQVFDLQGKMVKSFEIIAASQKSLRWNLTSDSGNRLKSGNYFCRIQNGKQMASQHFVVR